MLQVVAPAIVAKSDVNNICPGNPVKLTIVANPSVCGIPLALCGGKNVAATVTNSPIIQGGAGSHIHRLMETFSEVLVTNI